MLPIDAGATEQGSALLAAANWTAQLVLGTLGTTLALLAVAILGLRMLSGRVSPRDGLQIILGCFVLFGAPAIAAGIMKSVRADQDAWSGGRTAPAAVKLPSRASDFDPYAGAAVPFSQPGWPR